MSIRMTLKMADETETIGLQVKEAIVSGGGDTPTGEIDITENGRVNVARYATANVQVPQGITPTGTINITENGDTDVTNYATAHVAVPIPQPTGTISITENGTDIDVSSYAKADVAVPQPSGKITIDQNGTDVNIAQYATADIAVPQGVFPTGSQTFQQNGTYDVTNLAEAVVSVSGGLPSNYSIHDYTIEENAETLVVPYDNTKTVWYLLCYNLNPSEATSYTAVSTVAQKASTSYTRYSTFTSNTGGMSSSATYGGITIDDENAQITIANRGGSTVFRQGRTYRVIIIYTT